MTPNSRYRIIYGKTQPLVTWETDEEAAWKKAEMLERAGYDVQVWEAFPDGTWEVLKSIEEEIPWKTSKT